MNKHLSTALAIVVFLFAMAITSYAVFSADVGLVMPLNDGAHTQCMRGLSATDDLYDILQDSQFSVDWAGPTQYGHYLCAINGEGGNVDFLGNCNPDNDFPGYWLYYFNIDGTNHFATVGADGGDCWNRNYSSSEGHYCAVDGDVISFIRTEDENEVPAEISFSDICASDDSGGSKLSVESIDVKVANKWDRDLEDGDKISEEAAPGDEITVEVKLENLFTDEEDVEIQDIVVTATLESVDDGDDVDDETDEFDIDTEDDQTVKLTLRVPSIVEEDTYDLTIDIEADDEDGNNYDETITLELDVEKSSHNLAITRAELDSPIVTCEASITLNTQVANLGSEDERNVRVTMDAPSLSFSASEDGIDLPADDVDDSEANIVKTIVLPSNLAEGSYPITIKAYRSSSLDDTTVVQLTKEACVPGGVVDDSGALGGEEQVDVVYTQGGAGVVTIPSGQISSGQQPISGSTNLNSGSSALSVFLVVFVIVLIVVVAALIVVYLLRQ